MLSYHELDPLDLQLVPQLKASLRRFLLLLGLGGEQFLLLQRLLLHLGLGFSLRLLRLLSVLGAGEEVPVTEYCLFQPIGDLRPILKMHFF